MPIWSTAWKRLMSQALHDIASICLTMSTLNIGECKTTLCNGLTYLPIWLQLNLKRAITTNVYLCALSKFSNSQHYCGSGGLNVFTCSNAMNRGCLIYRFLNRDLNPFLNMLISDRDKNLFLKFLHLKASWLRKPWDTFMKPYSIWMSLQSLMNSY